MNSLTPPINEHQIQTLCNNFLKAHGFYVMRHNAGKMPMTDRNGHKRFVMLAETGTPDTQAFHRTHTPGRPFVWFIEYKTPKNKPTFYQTHKMQELELAGCYVTVCHSFEEIQEQYKAIKHLIHNMDLVMS